MASWGVPKRGLIILPRVTWGRAFGLHPNSFLVWFPGLADRRVSLEPVHDRQVLLVPVPEHGIRVDAVHHDASVKHPD